MTATSGRYAIHLLVLCGLALIPVTIHAYLGSQRDDCANPEALMAGFGEPSANAKRSAWMERSFEAFAWREGELAPGARDGLRFAVIRSHQARRLYHRPYGRFEQGAPKSDTIQWTEVEGERLPIHRVEFPADDSRLRRRVTGYLLASGDGAVSNVYLTQLQAAPLDMVAGIRPMTLFMVMGDSAIDDVPQAEAATEAWLVNAWRNYRSACVQ